MREKVDLGIAWGFSLRGHLGRDKIIALVKDINHQPHPQRDVRKFIEKCIVCQTHIGHAQNISLRIPLPLL